MATITITRRYAGGSDEQLATETVEPGADAKRTATKMLSAAVKEWGGQDDVSLQVVRGNIEAWDGATPVRFSVGSWNNAGSLRVSVDGFRAPNGDPVGLVEIAQRLGVARQTVDAWRHRDLLPEPRWTVGGRPAWDWSDIARWAADTKRG